MMKKLQLVLIGSIVLIGTACSSTSVVAPAPIAPAEPAPATQAATRPALVALEAESSPVPRLILRTNEEPVYASYAPQSDVFVIDFPRMTKATQLEIPADLPAAVSSVSAEETVELGSPLTRVTLRFREPVDTSVSTEGKSVILTLGEQPAAVLAGDDEVESWADQSPVAVAGVDEELPALVPTIADEASSLQPGPVGQPIVIENEPVPVIESDVAMPTRKATRVENVRRSGSGSSLAISIEGDGAFEYNAFELTNPERIVVDLVGVVNGVARKEIEVGDATVRKIRVGQFKTDPQPVARVVFDLSRKADYRLSRTPRGLLLTFGDDSAPVTATDAQPVEPKLIESRVEPVSTEWEASRETAIEVAEVPPPVAAEVPSSARHVVHSPRPEPQSTESQDPRIVESKTLRAIPSPEQDIQGSIIPGQSRTITAGQKVFAGEPINLDLTNADIKDVLRTFSELTGLSMAIDPQVSGTVTVRLENVPWDQALDLILRQNALTYVLQGNVMRVGTVDRLTREQEETRKLDEQERLNVPLSTVIKYLSYAKAADVQTILLGMASPRGKVITDQRTNQLIISEIPYYLQTMLNLIDSIDIPTPQVIIEARIVETTKNFAQQLGISWGFNGTMDPALGTGTGLVFPNRIDVVGGPFEFGTGNPVLDVSLGNVLGTFDLDVMLTAAESEGLVRIVSAPKVTTQDNERAEIQSGVQIPVQTRVNFTTTVTYIDATLRLAVTPQVTAEGTVIMEIQVQKTEPALGLQVVGGTNSPLLTRRAQTKLMVRDGGTTVIGGIYQATDNKAQSRVPFLHSIPIIGNLFKNRDVSSRHDELLIFITPRIVKNT